MNIINYKNWIITTYFNEFRYSPLFQDMAFIFECSPWHREKNVLTHTDMVLTQFIAASEGWAYEKRWFLCALACVFHDVGKPKALEVKQNEKYGQYNSFSGHEIISARLWENFVMSNWHVFDDVLDIEDVWKVSWLIEHHLPYGVKKDYKVKQLYITMRQIVGVDISFFETFLTADCYGRISDDHDSKKNDVEVWLNEFSNVNNFNAYHAWLTKKKSDKKLFMLIGASGSGKSTYVKNNIEDDNLHFSLDKLRHDWYGDDYREAYRLSCDDSEFGSKVHKEFISMVKTGNNIFADNINTSQKRRRFYIEQAKSHGYDIIAVIFPIALSEIIKRQQSRDDKTVPDSEVARQYMSIKMPNYSEFDKIEIYDDNLNDT